MLVAHLQDLHLLRTADGGWVRPSDLAAVPVPDTVRHVMARRLRVLTPASRDVLAAAAVVSRDVDVGFLARVAGLAIDDAVGEVDRVVAAGLVKERDDGTVGLAHALVRQSVIDELSKTRLARLHWRVGEELERLPAEAVSVDELAAHYRAGASVGDQAVVVRTSLAALDQALAQTAFEQAAEHARATLVALDRVVGRADYRFRALLGLGQALNLLGRSAEARVPLLEAAEIAKGLGDAEGLLTTLEAYCFVLRLGERDPVHLRIVDDIVSLLPEGDSPLRARVTGWRAGLLLDAGADPTSTLAMATDALAIARRTGDAGALIWTCASITYVAAASAHAAQALRLLDAVGPPPAHMATTRFDTLAQVRLGRAQLRLRLGRRDGIEAELDELGAQARERGLGLLHNNTLLLRGALAAAEGRFAEAKHLAATARDAAGPPTLLVSLGWGAQLATTRLEQGRAAEVVSMLDTIDNLPGVAPAAVAAWRAMRAGAMAQAGDHRRAGDELTAMAADGFGQFPRDQSFPLALRHLCELCRALGRPDEARMLLPEVSAYAGQILLGFLGTSLEGGANRSVGHLLATLGQHDEADRAYTAASRLERNAGFAPFTARTGYWHALVLLERDGPGDRERADHLLADTIDTANALGMALLHEHAHSLRARL
jgi:tetratricopeptide (TPR) repeat protein